MRPLIFFLLAIFLMSGICSCRSAKQSVSQTADSTAVAVTQVKASMSAEDVLSKLTSSTDIDLTGITVEFFPPDTAHPDARAAPKSLKIETAKAHNDTHASTQQHRTAAEKDTVNVKARQSRATAKDTRSEAKALSPPGRVVFFSILAVIVLILILIKHLKRNGTMQ